MIRWLNRKIGERLLRKLGYTKPCNSYKNFYYVKDNSKNDSIYDYKHIIHFTPRYESNGRDIVVHSYYEKPEIPSGASDILYMSVPLTQDEIRACYYMLKGLNYYVIYK